jgi:DNA-binding CsgD family transcriptional regulator
MELIGRDAELARLQAFVDGGGGALVVAGRPGVGKSALLAAATAGVGNVLSSSGVQSEIDLPFAGLRELLDPVLSGVDALPPPQRRALRAALRLDEPTGLDRGTVLHALVALVETLAPAVVAVDDIQWLDPSSREAVAFLARRAERVGVVVLVVHSLRGGALDGWPELPTLTVDELGHADALSLARRTGVAPAVAEALVSAVGGNPLALLEGPGDLTDAQRTGDAALPEPLPAGRRVTAAYAARLDRMPPATRTGLLLAATSSDGASEPIRIALAPATLAVLEPAEDDGLIARNERFVRFVHPEARSAIYHAAAPSERHAAHRALAAALDPHARAWHLAIAADLPDEELATALERSAFDAAARGAPGTAFLALRRSAALTPDPALSAARTLRAGHLALVAGRPQSALALASGLPPAPDAATRADTQLLVGAATAQAGRPAEGFALLEAEAERIAASDPGRAAALLTQATIALMGSGPVGLLSRVAARARALSPADADLVPTVLETSARAVAGEHGAARQVLHGRLDELAALDPAGLGHQVVALAGMCLHWMEEQDAAVRLIAPAVQTLRDRGAVTPLAFPLVVLASVHSRRGDFRVARELAQEAVAVGEETVGDFLQALTLNTRAFVAAYLGEDDVCTSHALQARAICERLGIYSHRAAAEQALGMLALSKGELATAIDHLERGRVHRLRYGARDPGYMFDESDLTEAYARSGRLDDAERMLGELRAGAELTGGAWAAAAVARNAALLGGNDEIDAHLASATAAHERVDFTFEEARTQLVFGERLRRARRRTEARTLLSRALATFREQGAVRWADRAAAELAAAGGGTPGSADQSTGELTAREHEVCALVAGGATNSEVAAALFLSPRTVEHHLSRSYRKLGVRSRSELAARFAT